LKSKQWSLCSKADLGSHPADSERTTYWHSQFLGRTLARTNAERNPLLSFRQVKTDATHVRIFGRLAESRVTIHLPFYPSDKTLLPTKIQNHPTA
jgi:hypothetical protein